MPDDTVSDSGVDAIAVVRGAWAQALGLEDFDVNESFFGLGGHSLLALEVVDWIEEETKVAIPLEFFFENPEVRALADYVESAMKSPAGEALHDEARS